MNRFLKTTLCTWLATAMGVSILHAQVVDVSAPDQPPGTRIIDVGALTPPIGSIYNSNPEPAGEPQQVSIPQTFAPFGHRPETDKTSEDGSVALRDLNGVIIWIDNLNRAVTIPNSALAKTLYVSNTECIVWQNRFAAGFNSPGSTSQVVIHRRDEAGAVVSSNPITLGGTLLETAAISPGSFSFTLITSQIGPSTPLAESRERFQSGADQNGNPTFTVRDVNQWDVQTFTLFRITFDSQVQVLTNTSRFVAKSGNLGSARVAASSADGSLFIDLNVAGNFFADQPEGGFFYTIPSGIWVSLLPNVESFVSVPVSRALGDILADAALSRMVPAYVTSRRLIYEDINAGTDGLVIEQTRQDSGSVVVAGFYDLPPDSRVLPVSSFTKPGFEPFVYTIDGENLQLHRVEAGLVDLGDPVALPSPLLLGAPYVRNPQDASLLIRGEGSSGVLWFRTAIDPISGLPTELLEPRSIPSSNLSRPMFVSSDEAILWMNAQAPVLPGGVVAPADLRHFYIDDADALDSNSLTEKNQNPLLISPIVGRYVASAPPLSPDANEEGWFISTFERTTTRAATMRTYRVTRSELTDSDGDGLPDWIENELLTDPLNADSDGDTLADGFEVFPYTLVSGSFTYEQAAADARLRGGWLAVPDSQLKLDIMKKIIGTIQLGGGYWLGAMAEPNGSTSYQWQYNEAGELVTTPVTVTNWAPGNPTTADGTNRLAIRSDYQWITLPQSRLNGYIMQFHTSNPRKTDTDADLLADNEERFYGTNPNKADTDGDGISDYLEVNGYRWHVASASFVLDRENGFTSNPLLMDSDGDGINDNDEVRPNPYVTNPSLPDTDGDGLTDGEELQFGTDPTLADSDGDGFSDFDEINAVPPTDPLDPNSRPAPVFADNYSAPVKWNDDQTIAIDQTFAQFGQRPSSVKIGEDGSAALRDDNGVLIWVNRAGQAIVVPNTGLADALFVTNTELVTWDNKFNMLADALGNDTESLVTMHRRDENGVITQSPQLALEGIIVDTPPVTPITYASNILTYKRSDDGAESIQQFFSVVDGVSTLNSRPVDAWDRMDLRFHSFTWEGQLRIVRIPAPAIPKYGSIGGVLVAPIPIGYGSDGSMVFNFFSAAQFVFTESEIPRDGRRRIDAVWISNTGIISYLPNRTTAVGHVSNTRVIAYSPEIITPEVVNPPVLRDIRRSATVGTLSEAQVLNVPGEILLPFNTYTKVGSPQHFYMTDASNRSVVLYNADNSIIKRGNAVMLPATAQISSDAAFVRNPVDASLLLKSNKSGSDVFWIRSTVGVGSQATLLPPITVRDSSAALPMFVSNAEAVLWNNGLGPVGPLGVLPPASISHLASIPSRATTLLTTLTPPIQGRYALNTPQVVLNPDVEGWFVHTFEKTNARTAVLRSYRLAKGIYADRDLDGLPDSIEITVGTDPSNPDTDDDGLTDGDELYPYYVIDGQFTWEEAVADAAARGGRLAVFRNRDDYLATVFRFASRPIGNLWLGATDQVTEGTWLWQNGTPLNSSQWRQPGTPSWAAFHNEPGGQAIPWAPGKPDNFNNADGLVLRSDMSFEDRPLLERRGYLIEYPRTDPSNPDTDGDGILDGDEIANGTNPTIRDPFAGVPPIIPGDNGSGNPFVPFTDPRVATSYEGLIFDPVQGHAFRQTLRVTNKGGFTSRINGLTASIRSNFKGSFNAAGYYLASAPRGLSNVVSIELQLTQESSGIWIVLGRAQTSTGEVLGIELRPVKYGRNNPFPLPGSLTMALPLSSPLAISGPRGDAAATGSTDRNGRLKLKLYLPDGGTTSFSGAILDGDLVALHAISKSRNTPALIGPVNMAHDASDRDYGGFLRYYSASGPNGTPFPAGFDQQRTVFGSRYVAPAKGFLPIPGYSSRSFNSLFNMSGGDFAGISKIGTWAVNHKITVPSSPTDRAKVKFASKTGLLTYAYTLTDPERQMVNAQAKGYAVALQKSAKITGLYTDGFGGGQLTVTPNDGRIPEITVISPLRRNVSPAAIVYEVVVQTPGLWELQFPADAAINNWVQAEITAGGLGEQGPDPENPDDPAAINISTVIGFGNGRVRVTVFQNMTYRNREYILNIAGINHRITQSGF